MRHFRIVVSGVERHLCNAEHGADGVWRTNVEVVLGDAKGHPLEFVKQVRQAQRNEQQRGRLGSYHPFHGIGWWHIKTNVDGDAHHCQNM